MFDFLNMMGNYEARKVANYQEDGLVIDTCAVTDSSMPFETGICHPLYNGGDWIIVELYPDKESAVEGHEKWVGTMTASELPPELRDMSSATLADMLDSSGLCRRVHLGLEDWRNGK